MVVAEAVAAINFFAAVAWAIGMVPGRGAMRLTPEGWVEDPQAPPRPPLPRGSVGTVHGMVPYSPARPPPPPPMLNDGEVASVVEKAATAAAERAASEAVAAAFKGKAAKGVGFPVAPGLVKPAEPKKMPVPAGAVVGGASSSASAAEPPRVVTLTPRAEIAKKAKVLDPDVDADDAASTVAPSTAGAGASSVGGTRRCLSCPSRVLDQTLLHLPSLSPVAGSMRCDPDAMRSRRARRTQDDLYCTRCEK